MYIYIYIYIYIYVRKPCVCIFVYVYVCIRKELSKNFVVKFICSGIYMILTRILQPLAKQQEAYLVHHAFGRGKGTNLASSEEHFSKWYLYGSIRMATLQ